MSTKHTPAVVKYYKLVLQLPHTLHKEKVEYEAHTSSSKILHKLVLLLPVVHVSVVEG